jgi:DNA-binding XRE family transcriptional regulator
MNRDDLDTLEDLKRLSAARRWAKNGTARRVRELCELTQAEIAEVVGVDPSTVALWETGQRTPSGDAAKAYARTLVELGVNLPGGIVAVERQIGATG